MEITPLLGGRYRLEQQLGSGGTSVVWRGFDTVLDRPVAVKILSQSVAADRQARRRIRAEAQAAARMSHPNITVVYDYGEQVDDTGRCVPYVVMELLRGQVLAARLSQGRLTSRLALAIGAHVAAALAAAQAHGLVHRDIKPGNVMLTQAGVKVFDFGIAAQIGRLDDADLTEPIMGSAAYVAPERLAGSPVTAASDVYALGVLLFRVLTHELPWQADNAAALLQAHVTGEPADLPELDGVPDQVRSLVAACLSRQPQDRPSAAEVATVLAAAAGIAAPVGEDPSDPLDLDFISFGTAPVTPRRAAVGPAEPARRRSARAAPIALTGAAILVLVGGLVFGASALLSGHSPAPAHAGPSLGTAPFSPGQSLGESAPVPGRTPGPGQSGGGDSAGPIPDTTGNNTPTNPQASPTSTGQPSRTPVQKTLISTGGTVVATCIGSSLIVDSAVPASGYWIQSLATHGTSTASVTFATSGSQVMVTVLCQDGVPATISPSRQV